MSNNSKIEWLDGSENDIKKEIYQPDLFNEKQSETPPIFITIADIFELQKMPVDRIVYTKANSLISIINESKNVSWYIILDRIWHKLCALKCDGHDCGSLVSYNAVKESTELLCDKCWRKKSTPRSEAEIEERSKRTKCFIEDCKKQDRLVKKKKQSSYFRSIGYSEERIKFIELTGNYNLDDFNNFLLNNKRRDVEKHAISITTGIDEGFL